MPNKTALILKATLFCMVFTGVFIILSFAKNLVPNSAERLSHGIIGTLAGFLTSFVFLKFDKKKFRDIELYADSHSIKKFLLGILAGVIIMGLLAAGVMYFTHVKIEWNPQANLLTFILATSPLILLAFAEELGFRAYPLQLLKDGIGIRGAIIITSLLFALYHIANGWTVVSSFSGPAVWGLLFGLAAIWSKGIAMPTGLHYAANLTTSAFGASAHSGALWIVTPASSVAASPPGIDWAVIVPAFLLLVLGLTSIELYMRKKGRR